MIQYVDPNAPNDGIPMESVKKKKKPKIVKEISVQTDDLVFSGGILNS